jgi:hypothetical protein
VISDDLDTGGLENGGFRLTGNFSFGQNNDPYADLNGSALAACEVPEPRYPHQGLVMAPMGGGLMMFPPSGDPEDPEIRLHRPTATDAQSGIRSHLWKVSSRPDSTWSPDEDWHVASGEEFTVSGDPMEYGRDFYVSVLALNRAGIQSRALVYGPFEPADPTKPSEPDYCASATGSNPKLSADFDGLAVDLETGIEGYEYRVREAGGGVIRSWSDSAEWNVTSLPDLENTEALSLQDGTEYYLDMRAVNGQGRPGDAVTSGPVLVDFSPPSRPGIGTIYVTASQGRSLVLVRLTVPDDPDSGIMTTQWAIHREGDTQPVAFGSIDDRSGDIWWAPVSAPDNLLLQEGDYVFKVRSVNGLGRPSAVRTRTFHVDAP